MRFTLFSVGILATAILSSASPIAVRQAGCSSGSTGSSAAGNSTSSTGASSGNLQPFTGSLGGAATPVTNSGDATRPFEVKGDTFVNIGAALQRSCDQQFNACANQANASGQKPFSVSDCSTQQRKSKELSNRWTEANDVTEQCNAADAGVTA